MVHYAYRRYGVSSPCDTLLSIETCSSLTLNSSATYKLCTSIITVQLNQDILQEVILPVHLTNHLPEGEMKPVRTGIKGCVDVGRTVITSTSVSYTSRRGTPVTSVHRERVLHQVLDSRAKQPSWVQSLMWTDLNLGVSHAVLWTENASPLPSKIVLRLVELRSPKRTRPHI